MKKLVLVVAMFMFVCGGSFLVKAQNSEKAATAQSFIQTSKYVGTKKVTPGIDEVGVTFL